MPEYALRTAGFPVNNPALNHRLEQSLDLPIYGMVPPAHAASVAWKYGLSFPRLGPFL
jgi:hypothetical protein